jgi:GDSL-like Lipase/Acylhydrolase family
MVETLVTLVTMTHSELPGVSKVVNILAYRYAYYDEGWRSADDPEWTGTDPDVPLPSLSSLITRVGVVESDVDILEDDVDALQASDTGLDTRLDGAESDIDALQAVDTSIDTRLDNAEAEIDALQVTDPRVPSQVLARVRADLARTRSQTASDGDARSTAIVIGPGDSFSEAFEPTKREFMWPRVFTRRMNSQRMSTVQFIPASAGGLNAVDAASWPGDEAPWVYSSAPAGDADHGPDAHAVIMVSGSTATLTYYGDIVVVLYTRTTTGPSAAAVTFDGAAQTALNANGAHLPGQQVVYGTVGQYGAHTLVITSTSGQLVLEGATVQDNEGSAFGIPCRAVRVFTFGHTGFSTQSYVDRTNWDESIAALTAVSALGSYPSLFIIALGANDVGAGISAATFQANLVTIMQRIDAAIDATGITTDPGFLLVAMPTVTDALVAAMRNAATTIGTRAGVFDLRGYLPGGGTGWGVFDQGNGHPNDAGQRWIADRLAELIDPSMPPLPTMEPDGPYIEATDEPAYRSAWTASFGINAGGFAYDASGGGTTVGERRHRKWLEPGTYVGRVRYERGSGFGTVQVLVGSTSLGTQSTANASTDVQETQLGTSVTINTPGAYPVTIRKTSVTGAIRFMRLHLRKTA